MVTKAVCHLVSRLDEKTTEVEQLSSSKEEVDKALALRSDELEILRGCVAEMTKVSSQLDSSGDDDEQRKQEAIDALLDTAKVRFSIHLLMLVSATSKDVPSGMPVGHCTPTGGREALLMLAAWPADSLCT